ncbi:MAG: ankyrin repeat domain-containing protein [Gammaproteobacteria bacterium]|nr:ankyrin repeat domain-containing protein [Gammaproteobacteria bacterium]
MRKRICIALLSVICGVAGTAAPAADQAAATAQLFEALKAQDPETALYALSAGADAKAREADGTTPLHYAAHMGDARLITELLKAKADPNARNEFGSLPLAEAATTGSAEALRLLLKAGADVESANPEGQTALMVVARAGKVEAAKLLIKAGANVNARERWADQSALMWAAAQGQVEMIRLLVKAGADVNARGATREWARRVTSEPRPKGMNRGGFTPLLYTAREGCIECARELLKGGADINRADPDQVTPLVLALLNLRFDYASFLIKSGADVNRWDLYGQTPLYVAIDMNTLPRGGRPDLPSEDFTTGLQVAEQLLASGANPNIQLKLRPPYRNYIFDRGGDSVLSTGATALLRAAKGGDVEAVRLLLKYKANFSLPTEEGVTPLMAAAGTGHGANPTRGRYKTDDEAARCVALLLEAGAEVNAADPRQRRTALHAAAAHGWSSTVRVLAERGAELEFADSRGLRAIDHAAGRAERGFLEPEQAPNNETMQVLRELIVARTGREPQEYKGPRLPQAGRTVGSGADRAQLGAPQ